MEQLFKSILEQDRAPIVVCNMQSTVVYMNPSAIARYKIDLTGKSAVWKRRGCISKKIVQIVVQFHEV